MSKAKLVSRAGPYLPFLNQPEESQEIRAKVGWRELMATEVGRLVLEAADRRQTERSPRDNPLQEQRSLSMGKCVDA